jgi:hypothetical protein
MFGFALSFSNLMGYIKCEKDHKAKVSNFIFTQAKDKLTVDQMKKIGTVAAQAAVSQYAPNN